MRTDKVLSMTAIFLTWSDMHANAVQRHSCYAIDLGGLLPQGLQKLIHYACRMPIAQGLDFAPELQAVVAPFLPALEHIGSIGIEVTRFLAPSPGSRRLTSQPATNRPFAFADPACDGSWFETQ